MTWSGVHPTVHHVHRLSNTGVRLSQKAMRQLEQRFDRLQGLEKYFVTIQPAPT